MQCLQNDEKAQDTHNADKKANAPWLPTATRHPGGAHETFRACMRTVAPPSDDEKRSPLFRFSRPPDGASHGRKVRALASPRRHRGDDLFSPRFISQLHEFRAISVIYSGVKRSLHFGRTRSKALSFLASKRRDDFGATFLQYVIQRYANPCYQPTPTTQFSYSLKK